MPDCDTTFNIKCYLNLLLLGVVLVHFCIKNVNPAPGKFFQPLSWVDESFRCVASGLPMGAGGTGSAREEQGEKIMAVETFRPS